jgi:3-oxoacyl-[acyl-carrier protein] reductase
MTREFEGKVALVTGAGSGIGHAIAQCFGREGASVVVNYFGWAEQAQQLADELSKTCERSIAVEADVSKSDEVQRMVDQAVKELGKIDILVNNAGVYAFSPLENITVQEIARIFGTNVTGLLLTTKAAVGHFPAEGGSIINIGSVVSELTPPGSAVYTGTKGAVDAITRVLAKELGPKKIRVNAVNPGFTVTEGTQSSGIANSDFETNAVAQTPLGRSGRPEDIADVVTFIASDDARWITGSLLQAGGGIR